MERKTSAQTSEQITSILRKKRRYQRWKKAVSTIAVIVVFVTTYALILPALTAEGKTYCGKEEHSHTEECYDGEQLTCELEEHIHSSSCYSNPEADLETADDWEQLVPSEQTGNMREDLINVAKSQLGYKESKDNYKVTTKEVLNDETGQTESKEIQNGYTRYGAWYGDPYADWSTLFVDFCLHYAKIDEADFPQADDIDKWIETLQNSDFEGTALYQTAGAYDPQAGDIIFLDLDKDYMADTVGIISEKDDSGNIKVIAGDVDSQVKEDEYELNEECIWGYGVLPQKVEATDDSANADGKTGTDTNTDANAEDGSGTDANADDKSGTDANADGKSGTDTNTDANAEDGSETDADTNEDGTITTITEEGQATSAAKRSAANSDVATSWALIDPQKLYNGQKYLLIYTLSGSSEKLALVATGEETGALAGISVTPNEDGSYDLSEIPDEALWTSKSTTGGYILQNVAYGTYIDRRTTTDYAAQAGTTDNLYYPVLNYNDGGLYNSYKASSGTNYYYIGSGSDISKTKNTYVSNSSGEGVPDRPETAATFELYVLSGPTLSGGGDGLGGGTIGGGTLGGGTDDTGTTNTGSSTTVNDYEGVTTEYITVTKKWQNADGSDDTSSHSAISVRIYKESDLENAVATLTLSSSNNWTATWTGANPTEYYTIKESPYEGYTLTTIDQGARMIYEYDADTTELEDGETYAFLYQLNGSSTHKALMTGGEGLFVEGTTDGVESSSQSTDAELPYEADWTIEKSGSGFYMKTVTEDYGTQYLYFNGTYFVTSATNKTLMYYDDDSGALYTGSGKYVGSGSMIYRYGSSSTRAYFQILKRNAVYMEQSFELINKKRSTETVDTSNIKSGSVKVSKIWKNANGTEDTSSHDPVIVRIYEENDPDNEVASLKLSESNNWTATWTGADPTKVYEVTEDTVAGYKLQNSSMEGTVQYQWTSADQFEDGETYTLIYQDSGDSTSKALISTGTGSTNYVSGTTDGVGDNADTDLPDTATWIAEASGSGFYLKNVSEDYGTQYLYFDETNSSFKTSSTSKSLMYFDNSGGTDNGGLYCYTSSGTARYVGYNSYKSVNGSYVPYTLIYDYGFAGGYHATFQLMKKEASSLEQEFVLTNTKSTGISGTTTVDTVDPTTNGTLTVKKEWKNADGSEDTSSHSAVTVRIYKVGDSTPAAEAATLSPVNGWTYTWTGLDANYVYTVKETSVSGYTSQITSQSSQISYDWVRTSTMQEGETYAIAYTLNGTTRVLTSESSEELVSGTSDGVVSKTSISSTLLPTKAQWTAQAKGDGFYLQNIDSKAYLYNSYSYKKDNYTYTHPSKATTIYYDADDKVLYTAAGKYMGSGSNIYDTTDNADDAAVIQLFRERLTARTQTLTLTNTKTSTTDASATGGTVTVKKKWSDGSDKHTSDSVTVRLYKEGESTECESALTLSSGNSWTASWTGLDANATYVVKEDAVTGYYLSESSSQSRMSYNWVRATELQDGKTYALVYTTNGDSNSKVLMAGGISAKLTGTTDGLSSDSTAPETSIPETAQWVAEAASGGGFYLKNTTTDYGTLYINNYTDSTTSVDSGKNVFTSASGKTALYYTDNRIKTVTGYYMGDEDSIYYGKTSAATSATFQLYEKQLATKTDTFTLTNEKDAGSANIVDSSTTASGTVTVVKEWSDGAENHTDDTVKVDLYEEGSTTPYADAGTLTLSADNDWTDSWEGLDISKTYEVKEQSVEGYTLVSTSARTEQQYGMVPVSSLEAGKTYAFLYQLSGSSTTYALNMATAASYVSGTTDGIEGDTTLPDTALWTVESAGSGKVYLKNNANTSYYIYNSGSYFRTSTSKTALTYTNNKLYSSSGYYMGSGSYIYIGTSNSSSAATIQAYEKKLTNKTQTFILTNKADQQTGNDTETGTVDVKVTKEWSSAVAASDRKAVTVHLVDADGNMLDTKYGTKILNSANNWSDTWTDLPDNTTYTVRESLIEGFKATVSGGKQDSGSITWEPASEMEDGGTYAFVFETGGSYYALRTNSSGVGYGLQITDALGTSLPGTDVSMPEEAQWTAETANSDGGYYLKNSSTGTDQYMYQGSDGTYSCLATKTSKDGTYETTKLYFEQATTGSSRGYLYCNYKGTTLKYFMYYASGTNGIAYTTSNTGYRTTLYLYKKVSTEVDYDYTITNSPSVSSGEDSASVTAKKEWAAGSTKTPVTVDLYDADGNCIDTKILNENNGWTYTWKNLADAVYTVEERAVSGYTSKVVGSRTVDTIWVPEDDLDYGDTILIGAKASSYSNTYYLWQENGAGEYVTTTPVTMTVASSDAEKKTIGGGTYSNYFKGSDVSDDLQWAVLKSKRDTSDTSTYPSYYFYTLFRSVADQVYMSFYAPSSGNWIVQGGTTEGGTLFTQYGNYMGYYNATDKDYYRLKTSGSYIVRNSYTYEETYSSSYIGTQYYYFKKVTDTNYNYTITNTPVAAGDNEALTSKAEQTKTIDSLSTGTKNTDTTVYDDPDLDLTELYRLYLNIGPVDLTKGVDLLIVVDKSGSMTYSTEFGDSTIRRDQAVNKILYGDVDKVTDDSLINQFLSMNAKNNVAVVSFAGYGSEPWVDYTTDTATVIDWTNQPVSFQTLETVDNVGTNYEAGFDKADEMFNSSSYKALNSSDNQKVMIFISDGVPTYYISDEDGSRCGNGGSGGSNELIVREPTLLAFDDFQNKNSDVITYTVGFSSDLTGENATSAGVLRYMAEIGGGQFVGAADGDALLTAMEDYILGGGYYKDAVITDQLSDYVDYYAEQPDCMVTMTTNAADASKAQKTILWANGKTTDAGAGIIDSVYYDTATRTIKAKFKSSYALEMDAQYELSFNVKLSSAAYEQRSENQQTKSADYLSADGKAYTGDENTDYGDNDTSSGEDGFRSNKKAAFSYTRSGVAGQDLYDYPVVQTKTVDMTVKKTNEYGELLSGAEFTLYQDASSAVAEKNVVYGGKTGSVSALPEGRYVEIESFYIGSGLLGVGKGTEKLTDLQPGHYYLVETASPTGYKLPTSAYEFVLSQGMVTALATDTGTESMMIGSGTDTTLTIKNTDVGVELPETGGKGRMRIIYIGLTLVLGALAGGMYKYSKECKRSRRIRHRRH